MNLNDELLIKHTGIEERKLKVSETMIMKGFVTIHVNIEVIELKEANISKLDKNSLKNLGKEKSFQEKLNDEAGFTSLEFKAELNLKHDEERVNRTIKQVGGVNLLGLLNVFKNPKKRVKNPGPIKVVKEDQLSALHKFFTTYYFVNDLKIPEGKLASYGEIANLIDNPKASRAVGSAVGDNPVSYLIPCHRVICSTGIPGQYHWGAARKKAMIGWEAARGMMP